MKPKKYLILENDWQLSERLCNYLREGRIGIFNSTKIFSASNRSSDEIAAAFGKHNVLLFQPTLIEFSQYNLLLMLMYDLITKNKLAIKEILIFTHRETIEADLKELWEGKRKYLDVVLKHVKLYSIAPVSFEKEKINI